MLSTEQAYQMFKLFKENTVIIRTQYKKIIHLKAENSELTVGNEKRTKGITNATSNALVN